jgi:hypothetical protein
MPSTAQKKSRNSMKYSEATSKSFKIFFVVIFCLLLLPSESAYAFTSQGDNYIFHMQVNTDPDENNAPYNQTGKFKIIKNQSPTPTPINIQQNPTATPIPSKPITTSVQIGYTANQPQSDFRFSISDNVINFGAISPTDFITRKLQIIINGDASYFYTVTGYENHQLTSEKNQIIPNTTCDDGNCTDELAGIWNDTLTFGFGYHCATIEGNDCYGNFQDSDSYKKFAVGGDNENGETILAGNTAQEKKVNIVYKINVPGSQAPGNYQNTITYLALPMY